MVNTKVLIIDDHEVVRMGLIALLSQKEGFVVVGEAGNISEAVQKTLKLDPEIIIMDIRLGEESGIDACRQIRDVKPNVKVIMLTSYANDEAVFASIMAGAVGYVLKKVGSDELLRALESIRRGEALLDPKVTEKVLKRMQDLATQQYKEDDALKEKEQKIIALIAEGKTNREIAEQLFLGEKTVRNYVSNILTKLDLSNRSQLATYATKKNIFKNW